MKLLLPLLLLFTIFVKQSYQIWEQKGMTFTNGRYCPEVPYGSEASMYSMELLESTGANYVAIVTTEYQQKVGSKEIFPAYEPIVSEYGYYIHVTETEEQLRAMINHAHKLELNVLLKLQIDIIEDHNKGLWRGNIGGGFSDADFTKWFESYTERLLFYARIAEELKVKSFSVGCEMINLSRAEKQWRKLIADVREVYSGTVVYSANWGGEETGKRWWDAVDIIGVDAYYPVCKGKTCTLEQIMNRWKPIYTKLKNLSEKWKKPLILSEVGYCSGDCRRGNVAVSAQDFVGQQRHYEAVFETFKDPDFDFLGVFWWTWNSDPASGTGQDNCITPQNKITEDLVREYYGGKKKLPPWDGEPQCKCTV